MITHQILITFDSARDFRDRQFANYDSTQMHWFLVRDKVCWWLTAEAGGFAERISQPKVTGQQVEQFMFSVLKKRGLLDDETMVEKRGQTPFPSSLSQGLFLICKKLRLNLIARH